MPKILFVDDEPHNLEIAIEILTEVIPNCTIQIVQTAHDCIESLIATPVDLLIIDIFLPLGRDLEDFLGPRTKEYEEHLRHLGGLAILDYVDTLQIKPKVLTHTACTDYELLSILGDVVHDRIPKPAALEVLLEFVQRELS